MKEIDAKQLQIRLEGGEINREDAVAGNVVYNSDLRVENKVTAGTMVNFGEAEGTISQRLEFGPEDQIIEHLFTMNWSQRDEVFLPARRAPNLLPTSKRISCLPHGAETLTMIKEFGEGQGGSNGEDGAIIRINTLGNNHRRYKSPNNNQIDDMGIFVPESREQLEVEANDDLASYNLRLAGGDVQNVGGRGKEGVLADLKARHSGNLKINIEETNKNGFGDNMMNSDSFKVNSSKFGLQALKSEESFQKVSPITNERSLEKVDIFKLVSGIERTNVSGDHGDIKGDLNMIFKKMNFTSMEQNQKQVSLSKLKNSEGDLNLGSKQRNDKNSRTSHQKR